MDLKDKKLTQLPPEPLKLSAETVRSAGSIAGDSTIITTNADNSTHLDKSITQTSSSNSKLSKIILILSKFQKYSSYVFTIFVGLHASAVLVAPLISTDTANEVMMIGRTIYQAPILEETIVYSSCAIHVAAGIGIRVIKNYRTQKLYGKSTKELKKAKKLTKNTVKVNLNSYENNNKKYHDSYGLGGVTDLLGLGPKKSWIYNKFGVTPLQFSGYCLIPIISGHIFTMRIVPLLLDGDSSLLSIRYISHSLTKKFTQTFFALTCLVGVSSYHFILGWFKYLKISQKKKGRKTGYILILSTYLLMLISVYKLRSSGPEFGFLAKPYDKWSNYLNELVFKIPTIAKLHLDSFLNGLNSRSI